MFVDPLQLSLKMAIFCHFIREISTMPNQKKNCTMWGKSLFLQLQLFCLSHSLMYSGYGKIFKRGCHLFKKKFLTCQKLKTCVFWPFLKPQKLKTCKISPVTPFLVPVSIFLGEFYHFSSFLKIWGPKFFFPGSYNLGLTLSHWVSD